MRQIKKRECLYCDNEWKELEDIICNKCGKSVKIFIDREHKHYNYEGLRAHIHSGFGSKNDGMDIYFDLCDDCLIKLMETFVVPPRI